MPVPCTMPGEGGLLEVCDRRFERRTGCVIALAHSLHLIIQRTCEVN